MDIADMPVEISVPCEWPLAAKECADETFPKVDRLEVLIHVVGAHKHLVTGFIVARHGLGRLGTLDTVR